MKTRYFEGCSSLDEVKSRYKKLAMKHHPDRGGDKTTMQIINAQYEAIRKDPLFKFYSQKEESQKDFVEFPEIVNQLIGFKDIIIELCGNWIWLSGATYRYKDYLKKIGFLFAGEKKLWYWRPHDYKSANRKPLTIDAIRRKYGSDIVSTAKLKEIQE
jgi:curved DNA-binding protein CbpA